MGIACTAVFLVTCVAVSRVYLQVHFPSDALAGLFLGLLWVNAIYKLMLRRGLHLRGFRP
ncbi:MAG: phosphatase PAP2 family protein [Gammaproteobacteria bacterium]